MCEQAILERGGIRNCVPGKPSPFIPNADRDCSIHVAAALDVNALVGVLSIAVDYCICKRFTQSHLNLCFASIRLPEGKNEAHELIHE